MIDAREVGRIPATQRRGIMDWITRDKQHLRAHCVGGALVFASPLQQGLWTAISWVTPSPIPVKILRDMGAAEQWVREQLEALTSDRLHDALVVAEMVIRGLMADARAPGHLAKADRSDPIFGNELHARIEDLLSKLRHRRRPA